MKPECRRILIFFCEVFELQIRGRMFLFKSKMYLLGMIITGLRLVPFDPRHL